MNPEDRKYAYFSMEVGLTSKIPTYSGGLGILAGDMLKASADSHLPIVGVTLLTKHGYFFQEIENNIQKEKPVAWSIDEFLAPVDVKIKVKLGGEDVSVGCWKYEIEGIHGHKVPIFFLHTDFDENSEKAKSLTHSLYGGDQEYRLSQEIVLGVGGVRILEEMGYTNINRYHMNEGHSALLALELERKCKDREKVREQCLFTTHTPVPAGHDIFKIDLVEKLLDEDLFKVLAEEYHVGGELNMTLLALNSSNYINGVAQKHAEISKTMFPNYPIHSITNGVHARTWVSASFAELYDKHIHHWKEDPYSLRYVSNISLTEIWEAHTKAKKRIIDYTNANTNAGMDYDNFTVGWARRFTEYKRPGFLFNDIDRLKGIAKGKGPIQVIFGGKAHPKDAGGKKLISEILKLADELNSDIKLAYLTNYDMYLGQLMTSGVDVWLNTPEPPHEASGTSGMKCALNGVPHLSVRDGWWTEGCVEGETGWSFPTPEDLYDVLENKVMPLFYENPDGWRSIMRKTIMLNGSFFNASRMVNEYVKRAYKNGMY